MSLKNVSGQSFQSHDQNFWIIPRNKRSQVIISPQNIVFLSLNIDFGLANSADPDEMPYYVAFHLGL